MVSTVIEVAGTAATVVAVCGVILNNRRRRECFYLWLVSNAVTLIIHLAIGVYSMAVRDTIFLALAVEGLVKWRKR
jgi:nicotinamide riboside transporter PnuC